jgi:hypothetical protein
VAVIASSCRREPPSNVDRNRAPETYITRAPAESSLAYYRVHLFWGGQDPDGSIAYYEFAITDSNEVPGFDLEEGTGYTRTLKTDSLFTLSAEPAIEQQILGHRFYVRAIDNEGKFDPTPALAYFVAKNDCYPEVHFNPLGTDFATWVDKCGNEMIDTTLTGADTIGVEGSIRWTWGGSDCDPGGRVVGFEWKMSSQTRYQGGTLADTQAEISFPPNASRRQTLQVRAIDDGGLRSFEDITRTVVLNFDPITWVLHPTDTENDGSPVRGSWFQEGEGGAIWPSGTTLPDDGNVQEAVVFFAGYDDPRDRQVSCDELGVHRYQYRILSRDDSFGTPAGQAYQQIPGASLPFPEKNSQQYFGLKSGDHFILVRSVDDYLVADSTPETVLVKINYSPYITELKAWPGRSPDGPGIDLLAVRNSESDPIEIQLAEDESLMVSVKGRDIHYPNRPEDPPVTDPLAAAFDSNEVVGQELGTIEVTAAYRVFFDNVIEPGFEPPGNFDPENPYVTLLEVERPGTYRLIADVMDRTNTNTVGRRGRIIRYIKVVR